MDLVSLVCSSTADKGKFHQLCLNDVPKLWNTLCIDLKLPALKSVTTQSVNRQVLKQVLQEAAASSQAASAFKKESVSMCSEEENAVRYACGYVAMKVLRVYKNRIVLKQLSLLTVCHNWQWKGMIQVTMLILNCG
jgi:hypothetical protein